MRHHIKLLTFTTLYPNSVEPLHGIFVERRLQHLLATRKVDSKVVAPVPWFPATHRIFGRYARFASVPRSEQRDGLTVLHPRYALIPKLGMSSAPFLMAISVASTIRAVMESGYEFDVIDAHYFFPDGVAAILLGRRFGKPVVITARGSDLNLIARYYWPRRMIKWAAERASSIVTVCQALKDVLVNMGVRRDKIVVLRNGVDMKRFYPVSHNAIRSHLRLTKTTLLSVGKLIKLKGHDIAIKALVDLPETDLLIVGEGEEKRALKSLAKSLGVIARVRFLGAVKPDDLKNYYSAADILVLASSREGLPNVLLESMACGTPVITTNVGGTPEVVKSPEVGMFMAQRTKDALVRTVRLLLANYPDREIVHRYARQFTWDNTTAGQLTLFENILKRK